MRHLNRTLMNEIAVDLMATGCFSKRFDLDKSVDLGLRYDIFYSHTWIELNFVNNSISIQSTRYKKINDQYFKLPDEIKNILNFHLDLFI